MAVFAALLDLPPWRTIRPQRRHPVCERIEFYLAGLCDPTSDAQDAVATADDAKDVQE